MGSKLIKAVPRDAVFKYSDLVQAQADEITSKTLVQNDHVSMTLFSFASGQEIGTHTSKGDALIFVASGRGNFTIGDTIHTVEEGESLLMPANIPHSIRADFGNFKWTLTIIFK